MRDLTVGTAEQVIRESGVRVEYTVGTMIELPRACIRADEIAEHADFFSFGTNDLTQTALGLSRDDAGRFLPHYLEQGILERDPFETIDQAGVGDLMRIAVERGRFCMAWIGLLDDRDARLRIAAHAGATEDTLQIIDALLERDECAFTLHALQTGRGAHR